MMRATQQLPMKIKKKLLKTSIITASRLKQTPAVHSISRRLTRIRTGVLLARGGTSPRRLWTM